LLWIYKGDARFFGLTDYCASPSVDAFAHRRDHANGLISAVERKMGAPRGNRIIDG
jgi:hypothetical protein